MELSQVRWMPSFLSAQLGFPGPDPAKYQISSTLNFCWPQRACAVFSGVATHIIGLSIEHLWNRRSIFPKQPEFGKTRLGFQGLKCFTLTDYFSLLCSQINRKSINIFPCGFREKRRIMSVKEQIQLMYPLLEKLGQKVSKLYLNESRAMFMHYSAFNHPNTVMVLIMMFIC